MRVELGAQRTAQQDDPASVLNRVRGFLAWRRSQPALRRGGIRFLDAPEPVLAFVREGDGQRLLVVFNLSPQDVDWRLPPGLVVHAFDGHGLLQGALAGDRLSLPPRGVFYARID